MRIKAGEVIQNIKEIIVHYRTHSGSTGFRQEDENEGRCIELYHKRSVVDGI